MTPKSSLMNNAVIVFFTAASFVSINAISGGHAEAGKAKSATCAACHGADGNSSNTMFPRLAGQHNDYLLHSLKAYKSGKRKNPIMTGQAQALNEQDVEDLAAYFSSQQGLAVKY
jgi:cytochrome c553